MSDHAGENECPKWLLVVAASIHKLIRDYGKAHFVTQVREWMKEVERQRQAEREFDLRRRAHLEPKVTQDGRIREECESSPPAKGWSWDEEWISVGNKYIEVAGWLPPELAEEFRPRYTLPLPPCVEELSLAAKYTALSAIYDRCWCGAKIVPSSKLNYRQQSVYWMLLQEVDDLKKSSRVILNSFFDDIERDLVGRTVQAHPDASAVEKCYFMSDLTQMIGVSDATVRKYANLAGISTPGTGKRDHRYNSQEVIAILREINAKSPDRELRSKCSDLIQRLGHQVETKAKPKINRR